MIHLQSLGWFFHCHCHVSFGGCTFDDLGFLKGEYLPVVLLAEG